MERKMSLALISMVSALVCVSLNAMQLQITTAILTEQDKKSRCDEIRQQIEAHRPIEFYQLNYPTSCLELKKEFECGHILSTAKIEDLGRKRKLEEQIQAGDALINVYDKMLLGTRALEIQNSHDINTEKINPLDEKKPDFNTIEALRESTRMLKKARLHIESMKEQAEKDVQRLKDAAEIIQVFEPSIDLINLRKSSANAEALKGAIAETWKNIKNQSNK